MATTDQQILSWLQLKVNEPADGGLTWPSLLWTSSEVVDYINQRQRSFLRDTAIYSAIADIPALTRGQMRYKLPQDCVNVWRVTWRQLDGTITSLYPADLEMLDLGVVDWTFNTQQKPEYYTTADVPAGMVGIAPAPSDAGTLMVHYVSTGDVVDGSGQIMTVPDEYVPTVRWGVLADMLGKNGRGSDPLRAAYAALRYQHGVEAAKLRVNGKL